MNWQQMMWAKEHDWYNHSTTNADGTYVIWVNSNRPEGGLCPFSSHHKLLRWAGY